MLPEVLVSDTCLLELEPSPANIIALGRRHAQLRRMRANCKSRPNTRYFGSF